ncbi:MAG: hypothetical protein ABIH52_01145 [Candidatus Aenigmatarchaeota archaeon]
MNKKKTVFSVLNKRTLEKLKKGKFTGRLVIEWKEGMITDFDLSTRIRIVKRDKKDFGCFFDFYD